jgi:hypothetical protein
VTFEEVEVFEVGGLDQVVQVELAEAANPIDIV